MPATAPDPQEWIRAYAGVQKLADHQLLGVLLEAQKDLDAQIKRILARSKGSISDFVRVSQLREIRKEMLRQQVKVFGRIGDVISQGRARAALAADHLSARLDAALFGMVGDSATAKALADSLEQSLLRTIDVATARITQSSIPLSQRIYNNTVRTGGQIDRMINSALARGLSAREFAAEALNFFDPSTPGGMRYAAMRLARTEINNAFHAMSVEAADKPWVLGMRWNLSRSHPKADDCDTLAHDDQFKMGPGVFPVRDVPRKPHPQCLCYATPVVVDDDAFIDGLFAGKYDNYLGGHGALPGQRIGPSLPGAGRVTASAPLRLLGPTPAQIRAQTVRTAKEHAKTINLMASGKARTAAGRELRTQATKTPYTMMKLNRVRGEGSSTMYGREFINSQGENTLAYYRLAERDISISPGHFDDLDRMTALSRKDHGSGWHSHSDRPGLEATVAHEYGHHVNFRFNDGFGNYTVDQAERIFSVVAKELGLRKPVITKGRHRDIGLTWTEADAWVAQNKTVIEFSVSKYGAHSQAEMFAEIWSEYTTSGRPRPWILKIGRVMQRMAEEATRP